MSLWGNWGADAASADNNKASVQNIGQDEISGSNPIVKDGGMITENGKLSGTNSARNNEKSSREKYEEVSRKRYQKKKAKADKDAKEKQEFEDKLKAEAEKKQEFEGKLKVSEEEKQGLAGELRVSAEEKQELEDKLQVAQNAERIAKETIEVLSKNGDGLEKSIVDLKANNTLLADQVTNLTNLNKNATKEIEDFKLGIASYKDKDVLLKLTAVAITELETFVANFENDKNLSEFSLQDAYYAVVNPEARLECTGLLKPINPDEDKEQVAARARKLFTEFKEDLESFVIDKEVLIGATLSDKKSMGIIAKHCSNNEEREIFVNHCVSSYYEALPHEFFSSAECGAFEPEAYGNFACRPAMQEFICSHLDDSWV